MNKLFSLALLALLMGASVSGTLAHAQLGGSVSVDVEAEGTSPLRDPDADPVISEGTQEDDSVEAPGTGAGATAAGDTEVNVSLTQDEAASASIDAASAELSASAVSTNEDLTSYATSILKRDVELEGVTATKEEVRVRYNVPARFLGFIRSSLATEAVVTSSGEVDIDYPWYRFLFAVEGSDEMKAELESRTTALLANVDASVGFTAALEARLIEALYSTLSGRTTASAEASGSASADASMATDMSTTSLDADAGAGAEGGADIMSY